MRKEDLEALVYPLPEDIEKLKWSGDLDGCIRLIHRRLTENIPEALKSKLRMEEYQIGILKRDYTVTPEEAQKLLTEKIRDWKAEELDELREANVVDWIFVNGEIRYINSFYENLIKIRSDLAARQKCPEMPAPGEKTSAQIRDEIIHIMKRDGKAVCRMQLKAQINLSDRLAEEKGELHVYLPLPIERFQMQQVKLEHCTPPCTYCADSSAEQRTVFFAGEPKDLKHCEIIYSLDNVMIYQDPKPEAVSEIQPDFDTEEQLPHIAFTPYLRALAEELAGKETNPLIRARRFYDFVTTKVNYSYMRSYVGLPNIPEYCASRLRGDCGVQALTFVTLCRIAGIPARWQSGLYADWRGADSHDWAMFYAEPYGWLWVDCSFGGAAYREGAMERWNFYFGNMDPYRVCLTQKFQGEFEPPMKFMRWDPYDNQRGEVEFSDHSADRREWSGGAETLSCELIAEQ